MNINKNVYIDAQIRFDKWIRDTLLYNNEFEENYEIQEGLSIDEYNPDDDTNGKVKLTAYGWYELSFNLNFDLSKYKLVRIFWENIDLNREFKNDSHSLESVNWVTDNTTIVMGLSDINYSITYTKIDNDFDAFSGIDEYDNLVVYEYDHEDYDGDITLDVVDKEAVEKLLSKIKELEDKYGDSINKEDWKYFVESDLHDDIFDESIDEIYNRYIDDL